MRYIEFNLIEEYKKFITEHSKQNEDCFRKKVLLPELKKCIKERKILKINVGTQPISYLFLDKIFADLMRKDKIWYGILLIHFNFEGDEKIIQDILEMLAKTEQELEFAEMEKLTLKERLFGLLPTTLQYLIKDFKKYLKARKEGRKMIVPPEIASYRMEQCNKCEHLNPSILGKRCKICGCFLKLKTPLSFEECIDVNNVRWGEWREDENKETI